MYLHWMLTLILVARTSCLDYEQDTLDEYSEEDSESSSHQVGKPASKKYGVNYTDDGLKGKIKRLLNKTIIEESDENNDLSGTQKTNDGKNSAQPAEEEETDNRASSTLFNYPFSVSIQRKGAHYATGALVDKRWILSCAGEFYNTRESIKLLRARLGSVHCKKGGQVVPFKRVEIHPSYVYGEPNFDLALLRMAQPVDFTDFIRPIGLSKVTTKVVSAKFMTTYWARLIVRGQILPTTAQERIKTHSMRVSTQRLIPEAKCLQMMTARNTTLDTSTMCLKPFVTHHSVCTPDAGAPVVAEDGLWGITSGWIAIDCNIANPSPTVFSRIASKPVRSWLDAQMIDIV
ncbi:hypodermin-A-like [Hyposmocoma kahamanoa]|uniref:hypodermin-A-like n=1 Tax=Hyposmocoma kahamanoa TaxID=1477025 RepID=UPI000E6DA4FD|nr:hypodermin-A-like [Hyposmocoma kahamanoa]